MTPRRVLMTADAVGGVWTYALELARGLSAAGTEVLLTVLGPAPAPEQREEAIAIPGLALLVPHLGLEWQDRAGPLGASARQRLRRIEAAFEPDLIHCNGFREAAAGFKAPVAVVAHSCVRTWWLACRRQEMPAEWAAYDRGVRVGLAAAAATVMPSKAFLDDFRRSWGPVRRPRVIPNGLDVVAQPAERRRPAILAAGRLWDEAKNVAALAGIAASLPWPVLVAGEPPRGGLDRSLQALGRLPRHELHRLMAEAAIFAAPARYEPFGLAVLEAACHGCTLVLANLPSQVEVWSDAARYVPPDDQAALRRTLLDLAEDRDALEGLQKAARERARLFSRQAMVEGYLALYDEILNGRPKAEGRAA